MMIGLFAPDVAGAFRDRAASFAEEGMKQGLRVCRFEASGLDERSFSVLGSFRVDGSWQLQRVSLPPVAIVLGAADANPDEAMPGWGRLAARMTLVAGEMPMRREELCRLLRQSALRTLVEPADTEPEGCRFRILLSRSAQGQWKVDRVAPLAAGVTADAAGSPLPGVDSAPFLAGHLKQMATELVRLLEERSEFVLPPVHIDLAVDRLLRTRFVDAGIGEGDPSRSVAAAIAFAVKLARDGNDEAALTVGMLAGWQLRPLFLECCHHAACARGARFFYFYPKGVDEEKRQISGFHWHNGRWEKALFPYPDVVYDRMKRRGHKKADPRVYEALAAIPFSHRLRFGAFNKVALYRHLLADDRLAAAVIPFTQLSSPDEAKAFLERYPKLIFKTSGGAHGERILLANRAEADGSYEVFDQTFLHAMSRAELEELLPELGKHHYFAQQFIESKTREGRPFHIRVHLMKNGSGQWEVAHIFPSLSLTGI